MAQAYYHRGLLLYQAKDYASAEGEFKLALGGRLGDIGKPDVNAWKAMQSGMTIVPFARPLANEVGAPTGKLRIAWTTTPASGEKIDPECVKAVHETVRTLEDLGHTLIEGGPKYDWDAFLNNVHPIWAAFTALSAWAQGQERQGRVAVPGG